MLMVCVNAPQPGHDLGSLSSCVGVGKLCDGDLALST